MLMPKRVKYRQPTRAARMKGAAHKRQFRQPTASMACMATGMRLDHQPDQIEAARIAMTRFIKPRR